MPRVSGYPHLQAMVDASKKRYGPSGKPSWSVSIVPDNGKLHYGTGIHQSLCGCLEKKRRETNMSQRGVDCPACIKELRKRP